MALWTRLADGTSRLLNKIAPPASITTADNALHSYDPSVAALLSSGGSSAAAWLATIAGRLLNGSDSAASLLHAAAAVLGTTADASIDADADGTIKGSLRGLAKAFLARTISGSETLIAALVSLRQEIAPTLGAQVSFAVSGADAGTGALAAGTYKLRSDVACWFRVNASAGGTAAAVETDPCELLMAGEWSRNLTVGEDGEIRAITSGGAGKLGYRTVA